MQRDQQISMMLRPSDKSSLFSTSIGINLKEGYHFSRGMEGRRGGGREMGKGRREMGSGRGWDRGAGRLFF